MGKRTKFSLLFLIFLILISENNLPKNLLEKNNFSFLKQQTSLFSFPSFSLESNFLVSKISPVQLTQKSLAQLNQRREILEYEVQKEESILDVAKKFSLSKETIIWANNLTENSKLKEGQKLIILPVDGVLHYVRAGETISEIAKKYSAKVSEIISFNELDCERESCEIFPGDILLIPGGKILTPQKIFPELPVVSNFFICPLPPCRITQGLHWFNAVDFSNSKCGEFVLAAASGKVIAAKQGWNMGAGNTVKILHQNSIISVYSHLQDILVSPGQEVFQGQPIGTVGKTGISTGCHLHFAVYGAKNPFAK